MIVHVEANNHLHRTLTKICEAGGSPSVALNPHTAAGKQATAQLNGVLILSKSLTLFYLHSRNDRKCS